MEGRWSAEQSKECGGETETGYAGFLCLLLVVLDDNVHPYTLELIWYTPRLPGILSSKPKARFS